MVRYGRVTMLAVVVFAILWCVVPCAHAAGMSEAAAIAQGKALYLVNCARCHGESGVGDGPDAAPLEVRPPDFRRTTVLKAHSDEELVTRIRSGSPLLRPLRAMPEKTSDTDALYGFLRSMPSIDWSAADHGRGIFLPYCSPCHGAYGHGDGLALTDATSRPRDLSGLQFQRSVDDRELEILVRHGGPGMRALDPPVGLDQAVPLRSFVRLLSPGYELYYRYCVSCHGPHGRTAEEKSGRRPRIVFDEEYFQKNPYPDQVRERIWHMLKGARPPMPHFEATLTAEQVKAILGYLRSLPALP